MKKLLIEERKYYHIYNRGNNGDNIFYSNENYYYLKLYDKYIEPLADTFAWVLLKKHFHILVYIKKIDEINKEKLSYSTTKTPKK